MPALPEAILNSLRDKLLGYRKRLLDLSLRNRLLNWKASKRFTLNLSGLSLAEAYASVFESEGKPVDIVPQYDEAAYEEMGRRIPSRSGFDSDLDEEKLAAKCLLSRRETESLERDSGINYCHLILGFLEWYDDHGPAKALRAPLILVPVKLAKKGINTATGIPEYTLEYDQTEIIVNPCLVEKMKDFNIEMPALTGQEDESPTSDDVAKFLTELQDIATSRPRWKVVHELKVTFISFAKIRMYRDLDPDEWPEDDALENKPLIQALFGLSNANEGIDGLFSGESIEHDAKADALPLVVAADSSQHEAIAAACRGLNMVIQGPPGTGKSQTITNIIAALMNEGKSVLFVAEKFAALDVVKRNLESVGLGDFVLELHGQKASRPKVYAELRDRLEKTFRQPVQLPRVRQEWEAARKTLNAYVAAAAKCIGPRNESYFHIIGKVEGLRQQKIEPPADLKGTGKPCARFIERDQFLTETQHLLVLRQVPNSHAWSDFDASEIPAGQEADLIQPLQRILQLLEYLLQCEAFVNGTLETKVPIKLEDAIGLTKEQLAPFAVTDSVFWSAKQSLSLTANRTAISACHKEASSIRDLETDTARVMPAAMRSHLPAGMAAAIETIKDRGFHTKPIAEIPVEAFSRLAEAIKRLEPLVTEACKFHLGKVTSLTDVGRLSMQLAVLRQCDALLRDDLNEDLFQSGLSAILNRAKDQASALSGRRQGQAQIFSVVGQLPPAADLRKVREDLKSYGASIFGRMFSKPYRSAKQTCFRWLTVPSVYKYPGIAGHLETFETLSSEEDAFVAESANKRLGPMFKGVPTDWARLGGAITWADGAQANGLTYSKVKAVIDSGLLGEVPSLDDRLRIAWDEVRQLTTEVEGSGVVDKDQLLSGPMSDAAALLAQWHAWLAGWVAPLQELGFPADTTLKGTGTLLKNWDSIDKRKKALSTHVGLKSVLGDDANGIETDWQRVQDTREWLDKMAEAGLPDAWFKALLKLDSLTSWAEIIEVISQGAASWQEILQKFQEYETYLPNATQWLKKHITANLAKRVSSLINEGEFLSTWAQYCRLRRRGDELGVRPYLDGWESGQVPAGDLTNMYRLIEYRRLIADEIKGNPALNTFTAEPHEKVREKFQKLDHELTLLNRLAIAARIGSFEIPEGNDRGPKRDWTDGALVRQQVALKKKQISLRALTARALPAVKGLKPCLMMSPMTVAQFLEPRLPAFDVLVMDEASQILPEDALGAIARADQLVVVGDPKQLPPTGFFKEAAADDEGENDEDQTILHDSESILDTCEAAFSQTKQLKWHYRSLHESLIAFSNYEFYSNSLQVFPSPIKDASIYGIRFHKVDGLYQNNQNRVEAQAVVEAVANQLRSGTKKSIAVVTFNLKQKELLDDLLAEEGRKDPALAALIDEAEADVEPLIIRNLESIQGEQRDLVYISVNFGPETPGGSVAQRFGPVNSATGWRRLNVLFSRAKERMEVYSSIYPDAIVAEPGAQTGPAYLSRFLAYAQKGTLETSKKTGGGFDSEFEQAVGDHLMQLGYRFDSQVGVAGFFIDLGVYPPGRTDRYMLGIECDGAAYHSSRVARDRDRIREDVLRGRQWNIYRIWSTDWYTNRGAAMKKLSAALKAAEAAMA